MPQSFNVSEVVTIVRKKLHLAKEQSLFLLIEGKYLMKQSQTLKDLYDKHCNEDGFLYVLYAQENAYGHDSQ